MNVAGCVGHADEQRQRYASRLESEVGIFDWLRVSRCELPASTVVCALNGATPLDVQQAGSTGHLVMGSVRRAGGRTPVPDPESDFGQLAAGLAGELYFAFASRDDGACSASVDPLGLFPLYYYSTPEFFLFASGLWAFELHPQVSAELDPDGLIGIFLTQGMVGTHTLLRGVTRLSPGHAVTWRPGRSAVERPLDRLRPTQLFFDTTFDDQVDALDAAMRSATARTQGNTMLLSGGLDSRLVAGYLGLTRNTDVEAISLGSAWQYDAKFAGEVAGTLGWRHRSIDIDQSQFHHHALIQTQHEQSVGSFWDLAFWQLDTELHAAAPVLVTGFCGNNVLEPLRHDPRQTEFTFERVFAACNRYGFAPDALKGLLRVDHLDERLDAAVERLRREYDSFDGEPFQKVLTFDLSHRARFLVGAVVWRLSFGLRPAVPYADPDVLKVSLGLPITAFRHRKLQRALLCRRFPELARLPIDTGSAFTRPLLPSLRDRVRNLARLVYYGLGRRERRYYRSVFDLNGDGWRAVRHRAEGSRIRAETVLDPAALQRLLPAPDQTIALDSASFYQAGSQMKSLLAFLLWAEKHL